MSYNIYYKGMKINTFTLENEDIKKIKSSKKVGKLNTKTRTIDKVDINDISIRKCIKL